MTMAEIVDKIYKKARADGITKSSVIAVVDFTLPSNEKRFQIIEMNQHKIELNTWVAHGKGSGLLYAKDFSNVPNSHKSSIGVFKTAEAYYGTHGRSMRIDGLEKGINDNVRKRVIVIHKSTYIGNGRTGRSWGCFAVPVDAISQILESLPFGHLLIAYYPDPFWLEHSTFINY